MIYLVLYFVFLGASFLDVFNVKYDEKRFVCFSLCLLLICIGSLRWQTGTDWDSYWFFFTDIEEYVFGKYESINKIETGYTYLNYFVHSISENYSLMLFVNVLIAVGLKGYFMSQYKSVALIALFFFYCYYIGDITVVRQFVALGIILLSVTYIEDRKFFPAFAIILLATSIHFSAIIFILAYWVFHIKGSRMSYSVVLILSFIIGFLNLPGLFFEKILSIIPSGGFVLSKLSSYSEEGIESTSGNVYLAFIIGAAKRLVVIPLFIWRLPYVSKQILASYRGFLNLVYLGNIIYFVFILSIPIMQRFSVYFYFFECLLWGLFIMSFKDVYMRVMLMGFAALYGGLRLYLVIHQYFEEYIPYKTVFEIL